MHAIFFKLTLANFINIGQISNVANGQAFNLPFGQSYKRPTIVIYVSRVINISNLLKSTTLEW